MSRLERQMLEIAGLPFASGKDKDAAIGRVRAETKEVQHRFDYLIVE